MSSPENPDYSLAIKLYIFYYNDLVEYPYRKQREEVIKNKKKTFTINWNHLYAWFEQHKNEYPVNLAVQLLKEPLEYIPLLSHYVYETLIHDFVEENGELKPKLEFNDYGKSVELEDFHVVITDIPNKIAFREIGTKYKQPGILVEIKGVVVAKVDPKPKLKTGHYIHENANCMAEFDYSIDTPGNFTPAPTQCPHCLKPGKFILIPDKSVYTSWQKLTIQELSEDIPAGETSRRIDVELPDYLIDSAKIGDKISVVGILSVKPDMKKINGELLSGYYIKANNIKVLESAITDFELTKEDEQKIIELSKDPNIVDKIIRSIAPSLSGLELEKEMIALSLFGGVPKPKPDGTVRRGDIHTLIIGDPGVGKSQLLQFVKSLMPRSILVDGKNATSVGITGTVTLDADTGEWKVEGGAMVLGDNGITLIDEFDKVDEKARDSLNMAMEQQKIVLNKADQHVELKARTTVIAVGNPKFIRYREDLTVAENINFKPHLLSRFDLISIIIDKPNLEKDNMIAEHINESELDKKNFVNSVIDVDTLKKYIVYARKNIKPQFTKDSLDTLSLFWVQVRNRLQNVTDFPIEITVRQFEGLLRISQAYAKMRLSNQVEQKDVERAINIFKEMLSRLKVDIEMGISQKVLDESAKIYKIIDELSHSPTTSYCAKLGDILLNAEERFNINTSDIERYVNYLRQTGKIRETVRNDGSTCYTTK